MSRTKTLTILAIAALGALGLLASQAGADSAPAWQISLSSHPTNFEPGALSGSGEYPEYALIAENVGAAPTSEPIKMTVQLPSGIAPSMTQAPSALDQGHVPAEGGISCSVVGPAVTCIDTNPVDPGEYVKMIVPLDIAVLADPTVLDALATIESGEAAATTSTSTTISDTIPPFGFLTGREGLNASATEEDGRAAKQAGAHPYQVNVNLGLPTQRTNAGSFPSPDGSLHDTRVELPAGLVGDPSAAPKCTAVRLQNFSCPDSTQVGIASIPTAGKNIRPETSGVFNLEPPPGYAAAVAFYVTFVPVVVLADVRPGDYPGGYRITSLTSAAPSILTVFQARLQLWGSPSDESHDRVRGACKSSVVQGTCPVSRDNKPFLSLPTSCTQSMRVDAHIDFWEEIGNFRDRGAELEDANGNRTPVAGCDQVQFNPTLKVRPTTNAADSPTGLEAELRVPQTDRLDQLSTAHLRKAVVTLPEGMAVNPSSANGLAACSSAQVGIDVTTGVANDNPVACPGASRIGRVEVDSPLVDHPLAGSVYVAMPHDNPFDSLLAVYVVVEDPDTGILVKLAGHVVADPKTGQLVTTFDNSPQLPFEYFKLNFFGGATAALRTPSTCRTYPITSQLTPWSAPQSGPPATPSDAYAISRSPRGGQCATSEAALPNDLSFDAGSASPIAGSYTPFVLNLSREDGSQHFSSVSLNPPPGLLAKLAGTSECSDAALAAAAAKSGNAEKASPSCPASSRIGSVEVAAGAGPAPYYTQGTAYLTGPYKGAPLGMAIVTPATAGPYDLGTVVVRTALHVDPVTTEITAISDPIPTILQGIPLDVRSARVSLDRPRFTINGTSCEPSSVDGTLFSVQGQATALFSRYQLGECGRLGFEPRLDLRLKGKTRRGGFPAIRTVYAPRSGDANLKGLVLRFPRSEFIEQSHFRTICTRVQFAAGQGHGVKCPSGSVYGHVRVLTPLLDETLEGPVFLRSSSHELPDVVLTLHGKIDAEVAVRVDSVGGGLRASVTDAPDVPVTKVILSMQGGNKGLFVNSRDICDHTYRARAKFQGHNGKVQDSRPKLKASCGKKKSQQHRGPR
jgi:hypothetical protein